MRLNPTVTILLALALAAGCAQPLHPELGPPRAGGSAASDPSDPSGSGAGVAPTTWWAGPDPSLWPLSTDGQGGRSVDVVDWTRFETVPPWPPDGRGYFGPDSFRNIPGARRPVGGLVERRTFYEIYGDRIYARSEGDTVHLNSWVVLSTGGFDQDSRYTPRVDPADPGLPPGYLADPVAYAVLHEQGHVHSPIGFRFRVSIRTPDSTLFVKALSGLYPVFEPKSVFRKPHVAGYQRMAFEGKAYAAVGAEDADGLRDNAAVTDAAGIADRVDAGVGTRQDRAARRRIIVFHVKAGP